MLFKKHIILFYNIFWKQYLKKFYFLHHQEGKSPSLGQTLHQDEAEADWIDEVDLHWLGDFPEPEGVILSKDFWINEIDLHWLGDFPRYPKELACPSILTGYTR